METVTSISGGKTSAYLAANYPTDHYVFSLVRTSDKDCIYPDKKLRQVVSDKIGKEFIGTLEDDIIIHTILDLEQFIGKEINWVSGMTFEDVITKVGYNYLPNVKKRFCTTELKIRPIFHWWHNTFNASPVIMNMGYRVTEKNRADRMIDKLNKKGLSEFKATFEKGKTGRNIWKTIGWRKPNFPLINDFIEKQDIEKYWKGKPVRFAEYNNCVGCFHRSASFLNQMSKADSKTFEWFIKQENKHKGFFKKNISYQKIKDSNFTMSIPFDYDAEGCESGFCGI